MNRLKDIMRYKMHYTFKNACKAKNRFQYNYRKQMTLNKLFSHNLWFAFKLYNRRIVNYKYNRIIDTSTTLNGIYNISYDVDKNTKIKNIVSKINCTSLGEYHD